jgi:putative FmdB family regulatory protein
VPLFDFRCKSCGNLFETLVRAGNAPGCPACGAVDLEKQLPTFALSTDERRAAAAKQSRQRQIAARQDAIIADEEYRQKHDRE